MRISATLPASSRGFQPAFLAVASATFDDQSPCSRRAGRSRLIVSGSGTISRVERAPRRLAASWSRITVGGLSGGGRAEAPYPATPPAPEPVTTADRMGQGACDRRPGGRRAFRNGHAPQLAPAVARPPASGGPPCSPSSAPGATTTAGWWWSCGSSPCCSAASPAARSVPTTRPACACPGSRAVRASTSSRTRSPGRSAGTRRRSCSPPTPGSPIPRCRPRWRTTSPASRPRPGSRS